VSNGSRRWLRRVLVSLAGGLVVAAGMGISAMQLGVPTPPNGELPGQIGRERSPDEEPYANREIQQRQMKRLREEHQKEIFNDTARLLQLATALKSEVDKGNGKPDTDALTADVIKQADEIGKLAKKVSDRIKTQ
jgi:hypothetical protein